MKIGVKSNDLVEALGQIETLVHTFINYHPAGRDQDDGIDCVLTALKAEDPKESILLLEVLNNGLYVQRKLKAVVETEGRMVTQTSLLGNLPKGVDVEIEYNKADNPGQFTFHTARDTKGRINVNTDQSYDPKPLIDVPITNQFNAQFVREAFESVAFKDSGEKGDGAMTRTVCRLHIKGNTLKMTSNDSWCASFYATDEIPLDQKELDITFLKTFIEPVLKNIGNNFEIGVKDQAFRVKGEFLDIVHPTINVKATDLENFVKERRGSKTQATLIFKASDAFESLDEALSITKSLPSTDKAQYGRTNIKVKNAADRCQVKIATKFGQTDSNFQVLESTVANTGKADAYSFEVKGKVIGAFLQSMDSDPVQMSVWDDVILLENKNKNSYYVMPTLMANG